VSKGPVQFPLEQHKEAAKSFARDQLIPFVEAIERLAAHPDTPFGDRRKLELVAQEGRSLVQRIVAL